MFEGLEPRWQGAEAKLFVSPFAGEDAIWKVRIPKAYRHPDLERRLTSRRILQVSWFFKCLGSSSLGKGGKGGSCSAKSPLCRSREGNAGHAVH